MLAAPARPAAPPGPATTVAAEPIVLEPGEVRVLDLPGLQRVAVGDGRLVEARAVEGRQLVLMGTAPGHTTLVTWQRGAGRHTRPLRVEDRDPARVIAELRHLLAGDPGVQVHAVGRQVVIEGRAASEEAHARIAAALRAYPLVLDLLAPPPHTPARLPPEPMIQLDVKVFEVRRSALLRLGLRWNADGMRGPGAAVAGHVFANTPFRGTSHGEFPVTDGARRWVGYLGLATEITSTIDLLEQSGDGWTLAEPRLSCKSGGEARFVAGGEIPIPVSSGSNQVSVVYKAYGVIVEFRPVVDDDGNVASRIVTEVSEPDPRHSNQGFVAFTQNRTETEFLMREGETLVISGLLKNGGARAAAGLPGLGRLPVIGRLFRGDEFRNDRTELVVMVTPRVVAPGAPEQAAQRARAAALAAEAHARIERRLAD